MKRITALVAAVMLFASNALAETRTLSVDISDYGYPTIRSGWKSDYEYQDESIHVAIYAKDRKPKMSSNKTVCRWVTIEVKEPTQLRTAISHNSYDSTARAKATAMAKSVNAVVAMNSDFIKYDYSKGYVMRQGVFYRDALDGQSDVLVIDDHGDFYGVKQAESADVEACIEQLRANGREPVNVFTFGPVLVENGVLSETVETTDHYGNLATQRIALLQLGDLKYAIFEIDSDEGSGTGMTLAELGRFILEIFPDCKLAYNFDGGGSTSLIINGRQVHKTVDPREISDIIYFASTQIPQDEN